MKPEHPFTVQSTHTHMHTPAAGANLDTSWKNQSILFTSAVNTCTYHTPVGCPSKHNLVFSSVLPPTFLELPPTHMLTADTKLEWSTSSLPSSQVAPNHAHHAHHADIIYSRYSECGFRETHSQALLTDWIILTITVLGYKWMIFSLLQVSAL